MTNPVNPNFVRPPAPPPKTPRERLDEIQATLSVPADDNQAEAVHFMITIGRLILARLDRIEATLGLPPLVPPTDPPTTP